MVFVERMICFGELREVSSSSFKANATQSRGIS